VTISLALDGRHPDPEPIDWEEPEPVPFAVRVARVVARLRCDWLFAALDVTLLSASYLIALVLRFDGLVPPHVWFQFSRYLPLAVAIHLGSNGLCGLYGRLWRHASVEEARRVLLAGAISLLTLLLITVAAGRRMPISVVVVGSIFGTMLLGATRFQSRLFALHRRALAPSGLRVAILGAGEEAAVVLRAMLDDPRSGLVPVVILDDDPRKQGRSLRGVPVAGRIAELPKVADHYGLHQALVSADPADRAVLHQAAEAAEKADLPLKVLPSVAERVGSRTVRELRDLSIDDLLGRDQIETDLHAVGELLRGKRLLVTGGGGSIGAEVARQVARYSPAELVLLDHDETHLYDVAGSVEFPTTQVLADIRDHRTVEGVFALYCPEIVFHAAAHKHVPLLEDHPSEAALTNVVGTRNVIDAAASSRVDRLVFISTDKAVRPSSVMGASKRIGEYLVMNGAPPSARWCAVRFGNVLGSRGSVVPTFMRQIANGGPVTVTDPRMTRYFISLEEAVELVLQAAALSEGGEIFMLEMGHPVRIIELAERMIRLSGLAVGRDIEMRIIGSRPGEKLVEELAEPEEERSLTGHSSIVRLEPLDVDIEVLRARVRLLEHLAWIRDDEQVRTGLHQLAGCRPPSIDLNLSRLALDRTT
jgi:FlaA1/EpsC-like NDP-sugar epimerase